uniref:MATH domain-containing protein n=1 Tax=Strigamia maritima TaxID=126957 RepID=T1ILI7_STRMM
MEMIPTKLAQTILCLLLPLIIREYFMLFLRWHKCKTKFKYNNSESEQITCNNSEIDAKIEGDNIVIQENPVTPTMKSKIQNSLQEAEKHVHVCYKILEEVSNPIQKKLPELEPNENENENKVKDHLETLKNIANTEMENFSKKQAQEASERQVYNFISNSHSCMFIWKLHDYSAQKHQVKFRHKKEIYSEPFLTNPFGYKMCLVLKPRINDLVLKIYLGCYLKVLPGPMDNILTWPLKSNVKITILDQLNGCEHRSYNWKNFTAKVPKVGQTKLNTKDLGTRNFIPLDELLPFFLVDNSLLFKVEVKVF